MNETLEIWTSMYELPLFLLRKKLRENLENYSSVDKEQKKITSCSRLSDRVFNDFEHISLSSTHTITFHAR